MFVIDLVLHTPSFLVSSFAIRKVIRNTRVPIIFKIVTVLLFLTHFSTNIFYCAAVYQFKPNNNRSSDDFEGIVDDGLPTTSFGESIFLHEMSVCLHLGLTMLVAIERYINKNYSYTRKTSVVLFYLGLIFIASYYGALGLTNDGLQEHDDKQLSVTFFIFILQLTAPWMLRTTMVDCVRTYRADIGQPLDERCFCNRMKSYNKNLLKSLIGESAVHLVAFVFRLVVIKWYGGIDFDRTYVTYHYLMVIGSTFFSRCILAYPRRNLFDILKGKKPFSPILMIEDRGDQHFAVLSQMWQK